MKKLALLLLLLPARALGQYCPGCIQNSASPQTAQMNIGTATIRGNLFATTATITWAYLTNVAMSNISGSGAGITDLNATSLAFGTISTSVVSGNYQGITGVGTISSGTWNGAPVDTQHGGTGQNFVTVSSGSIIYFDSAGHMATLLPGAPQQLLQTNGYAAPVWVSSPAISGLNFYGVSANSLLAGTTIPASVLVSSNSVPYINGAAVHGNISGNAGGFSGTLAQSQIATGTWSSAYPASSITVTGIAPGACGDGTHIPQVTWRTDGRASSCVALPLGNSHAAYTNVDNAWSAPQTFFASATVRGPFLGTSSVTASAFFGDGSHLTGIAQASIGNTVSSSWTVTGAGGILAQGSSVTASAFFGNGAALTGIVATSIPNTVSSSWTVTGAGGLLVRGSSVTASAFFGNGAALTGLVDYGPSTATLADQIAVLSLSTAALDAAKLDRAGDTMTGALTLTNVALNLTGAGGNVVSAASVTASAFFGNGAALTGIPATTCVPGAGSASVLCSGSANTAAGSNATVSGGANNAAAGVSAAVPGGALNSASGALSFAAGARALAANPNTFVWGGTSASNYETDKGTGSVNFGAPGGVWIDSGTLTVASSVTASAFFGNGSGLTSVTGTDSTKVAKAGDTMTGALNLTNVALNLSGANGNVVSAASVTAAAFFAPYAIISSSVSSPGATISTLLIAPTVKTNTVNDNGSSITIQTNPTGDTAHTDTRVSLIAGSYAGVTVGRNDASIQAGAGIGLISPGGSVNLLTGIGAAALGAGQNGGVNIYLNRKDGNGASGLPAGFTVGGGSMTILGPLLMSSDTASGAANSWITTPSSVTASAFFGNGAALTGIASEPESVNASMTGSGTVASPLGVASSSVAVLSGGYVLNSQIDPSSVTKQGFVTLANLSGAVPSGRVDFSTITTVINSTASYMTNQFTAVAAATTTINTNLALTSGATQTLAVAVAASTTTLFNVRASSGVNADITSLTGLTGAVTLTGANGNVVSAASVTASAFFGGGLTLNSVGSISVPGGVIRASTGTTGAVNIASISTAIISAAAQGVAEVITAQRNAAGDGGMSSSNGTLTLYKTSNGATLSAPSIVHRASSGTADNLLPFVNAPSATTSIDTYVSQVSTGLAFFNEFVQSVQIEAGGTCNPGSTCILPSKVVWQAINQAGTLTQILAIDSTGQVLVGGSSFPSSSNVKFRVQSSTAEIQGDVQVGGNIVFTGVGSPYIYNGGSNGFIGVNKLPATMLDVAGSASFGSGATQSTFTATGALVMDTGASITASSATFVGLSLSTQTAGGAGVSVTATCRIAGTFATGGGCSCAGGVGLTGTISIPNCVTAGCIPTGWTCQDPGGTGGACSAYVMCSRLQ